MVKEDYVLGLERIRDMLMSHSEACKNLADQIGGDEKLKPYERDLIRHAVMPMLKESSKMVGVGFVLGDNDLMNHELEVLMDIVNSPIFKE